MPEKSSVADARYHGKSMAFGDFGDGRKRGYTSSPWRDSKRSEAYSEGYQKEWDSMTSQFGPVVIQDHRGDPLVD